jgi:hypothetical protein
MVKGRTLQGCVNCNNIRKITMNSLGPAAEKVAQSFAVRKSWNALAGAIGRRVKPHSEADRVIGMAYAALQCATAGDSWDRVKTREWNAKETRRLIATFDELAETIKGEEGDPGMPTNEIENLVKLRCVILKQEREAGEFVIGETVEPAEPAEPARKRKGHSLPPVGTSVWCGAGNALIALEVVPTPIRYFNDAKLYNPESGKALLVLNGARAGAFNAAPTALVEAIIGQRCRSGWSVMIYDPNGLGHGEISIAARALLAEGNVYLCETKNGQLPPESTRAQEMVKTWVTRACPVGAVSLENYSPAGTESVAPVTPPLPSVQSAPIVQPTLPVQPVDFTEYLKQLRELLPIARDCETMKAVVQRYNELLPQANRFDDLKLSFHLAVEREQKRLTGEYIDRKCSLDELTRRLAELEKVAGEF